MTSHIGVRPASYVKSVPNIRVPWWLRFRPQPDSDGFHQSDVWYGSGGHVPAPGTMTALRKMPSFIIVELLEPYPT